MNPLGSAKAGLWPPFRRQPRKTARADILDRCTSPRSETCGRARAHPQWSRARTAANTKNGSQIESTAESYRQGFFVRLVLVAVSPSDPSREIFSRCFRSAIGNRE